jgi:hypothetical protein
MSKSFDEKILETMELVGTHLYEIKVDKNGIEHRKSLDPDKIKEHNYEQIEIIEYFRKKKI